MSLKEVNYKAAYVSGVDNLVMDFYIPTLQQSVLYQRRTGYFNSRALAMAARGISGLLKNGGNMQLLCSVQLDRTDEEVMRDPRSYLERKAVDILEELEKPYDELEKKRLGLLAHLLDNEQLEIKIALRSGGIYHEKAGIFRDKEGNIVAFNGSGNETPGGWVNNHESFHVFTSWEDYRHITPEIDTFERLWGEKDSETDVMPLPKAVIKGILKFKDYFREGMDEEIDPTDIGIEIEEGFQWTPELAYAFEAKRLWNHHDFAYGETAIEPFEHQDYIASTVIDNWPPRFLFADEVGLGKTIEAGLVIKGFLAAGMIQRLLILAPANVVKQWQEELYNKFGISGWILKGNYVYGPQIDPKEEPPREPVDAANPFRSKQIILASSQLIRSEERLEQLLNLEFDMVILDEAHHARATGPAHKREKNKLLQAMEELRYHTQGLILMTATPIQLSRMDLWDLLSILELPGRWQDASSFDMFFNAINADGKDWSFLMDMVKSNIDLTGIDEDSLKLLREDFPEVDEYKLLGILKDGKTTHISDLSDEEKEAFLVLLYRHTPVRQMIFRHTRELLKRYRKEGKFKGKIADRNPERVNIELRGSESDPTSERGLYNKIEHYVKEYYAQYNDIRKGMGFLMETYRKRLTSSMYAIKKSLEKRHDRLEETLETGSYGTLVEDLEEDDLLDLPDNIADDFSDELADVKKKVIEDYARLREVIEEERDFLKDFLRDLRSLPHDSKAEKLDEILGEVFGAGKRQVIIFSQFKDTVDFLLDYFKESFGRRLGSYSGQGGSYWDGERWSLCTKQEIQNKFSDPQDPLDILICTDAASEGLNLQTCDTLINYDVPWNPMRIEQRIGRIDRIGQESPIVDVHTIFYKDSVEEKAYNRCLERINYFKSALGHLQPILQATEKAIRNAALAKTPQDEKQAFESMEKEIGETVAQVDENLRIERLLNHYTPKLPLLTQKAPISQDELEDILGPILMEKGWTKEDDCWIRGPEKITFDHTLMDRKGGHFDLITPHSNLSLLTGTLGSFPDSIEGKDRTIHRVEVEGYTGFIVETQEGFFISKNLKDLSSPDGERDTSLEDAKVRLRYIMAERRKKYLETELNAWENREHNWRIRVRMYLDTVARWRWHTATTVEGLFEFSKEALFREWNHYLDDSERKKTKQLAEIVDYKPGFDPSERKRGRPAKKSPRDSRKEDIFLEDLKRITSKLNLIQEQLSEMRV